jgi:hypothetical protein
MALRLQTGLYLRQSRYWPTELTRGFGMSHRRMAASNFWPGGSEAVARLKAQVAAEIKTFASHYTRAISLLEALDPDVIAAYSRRSTGEKFLINPHLAVD